MEALLVVLLALAGASAPDADLDPRDPRAIAKRLEKVPAFVERQVEDVVVERRGDAYLVVHREPWERSHATWGAVVRSVDHAHWRAGYGIHGPTRLEFVTMDRVVTTPLQAAHDCRQRRHELDAAELGACVLRASTWRER